MELTCPACEDEMREFTNGALIYEVCTGCEGMWFDFGELKEGILLESAPNMKAKKIARGDDNSDHTHHYQCCKCEVEMDERESSMPALTVKGYLFLQRTWPSSELFWRVERVVMKLKH